MNRRHLPFTALNSTADPLRDLGARYLGRLVLAVVALACACLLHGRARLGPSLGQMDEYARTLVALEHYRTLEAEDDATPLPETGKPVEPGDLYEGVPRLVRLMCRLGDLRDEDAPTDSDLYQGKLVAAVQRFQSRHGLEPDGRIDRSTLTQLNTPLRVRVHQLELALERWRRRPYDASGAVIVVNLPEFRLRAFRDDRLELEMKVIDGQAPEHKTPLLSSTLETVIFRPYWDVPLTIQRDELVPEILKDHTFLLANHLDVVTPQGVETQRTISDGLLAQLRSGKLHLRQMPGPKNVLGLAKFVFPNPYEVYMHATSAPWLFDRSRRDLSHGCIRVENAQKLAEWVLRDEADWSRDRIRRAMQGSETIAVQLRQPIQVVTTYVTAVALADGEVHFFPDIYGEDDAFERELLQAASR